MWLTRDSWSRRRRVVAKAEHTRGEGNPRFVVTSLKKTECKARYLYEKIYYAALRSRNASRGPRATGHAVPPAVRRRGDLPVLI